MAVYLKLYGVGVIMKQLVCENVINNQQMKVFHNQQMKVTCMGSGDRDASHVIYDDWDP